MSTSARLASRCHTLLTTASSSSTSWLMTISPPRWLVRKPRSQAIESASRWLVGSSSSSVSASEKRMRASSTRRRWPPDRVRSGWASTPVGQAEVGADAGGVALGGVPAHGGELVLEPAVAAHRLVPLVVVGGLGHGDLRLDQLVAQDVEPAAGEHAVAGGDVEVAAARVLREVADLAGDLDLAGVRARAHRRAWSAWWSCRRRCGPTRPIRSPGCTRRVGVADEDAGYRHAARGRSS